MRLSPRLDLSYAIDTGKLVVFSDPSGVLQALRGGDDLAGSDAYRMVESGARPLSRR